MADIKSQRCIEADLPPVLQSRRKRDNCEMCSLVRSNFTLVGSFQLPQLGRGTCSQLSILKRMTRLPDAELSDFCPQVCLSRGINGLASLVGYTRRIDLLV